MNAFSWSSAGNMSRHLYVLLTTALLVCPQSAGCKKQASRYQRLVKSAEARLGLKRIADGARRYYNDCAEKSATGSDSCQFPSAGPTPATVPCGRRPVRLPRSAWNTPGWRAVRFSMSGEPQRYQYELSSTGSGREATFTARATGDLDCDGKVAVFELTGRVNEQGRVVYSSLSTENETE